MAENAPKLLLIGCGELGGAMLKRWLATEKLSRVHVVKPSPLPSDFNEQACLSWSPTPPEALDFEPDAVLLAIRPQHLEQVLPLYKNFHKPLIISILAGKTIARIEEILRPQIPFGAKLAITRVMPNLPAQFGESASFAAANSNVTKQQQSLAEVLMTSIGTLIWMDNEQNFDLGTALSGCGPAYVFALTDALASAAAKLGLSPPLAAQLARQTVIGSAAVLKADPEEPATLRDQIGNPGTMTEAAMKILSTNNALEDLLQRALAAAVNRARELGR